MDIKAKRTLIGDLSACRAFLQGMAMLWIISFHLMPSLRILGDGRGDILLRAIMVIGYGGCDVFLLLSGFGLARSLQRDAAPLRFYGRRIQKLWPSYYVFMIVFLGWLAARNMLTWQAAAGNLLFFGFWKGLAGQFNWYVQAIMVVYLLAPLLHWLFERIQNRNLVLGLLMVIYVLIQFPLYGRNQMVFISRWAMVFIGFWLGRHEKTELPWKFWYPIAALAACAVGYVILNRTEPYATSGNGVYWYPFLLIGPGLCVLAAWLRPFFLKVPGYPYLDAGICQVGICSFEIYLSQGFLIEWVKLPMYGPVMGSLLGILAIVLGIGFHYAMVWAGKRLTAGYSCRPGM